MANFTADQKLNYTYQRSTTLTWAAGIIVLHAGLNIFLSITASLGNALILFALHKVSSLYPPTKLLFRCLAVTDLCVGLISQPLHTIAVMYYITRINWKLVYYARDLGQTISFMLCGASILTSTAISVDRLLALLLGLRYRHVVTSRRIRVVIICFLLVGVSVGLMHFFWRYDITLIIATALLLLCLVISVFSYTKIFLRLRQHQTQLQDNVQQAKQNGGGIALNIARYKKTVSGIAWVQLALVACYVPFAVTAIIIYKGGWRKISDMVWLSAGTLVFLNSSLNPFLYCWKIRDVRQAVKDTIRQFCCSF